VRKDKEKVLEVDCHILSYLLEHLAPSSVYIIAQGDAAVNPDNHHISF